MKDPTCIVTLAPNLPIADPRSPLDLDSSKHENIAAARVIGKTLPCLDDTLPRLGVEPP